LPQLAVFNVCDSGAGGPRATSAGVRVIVACQDMISYNVALTFSRTFYTGLRGRPVRAAYEDAIVALAPHDRHCYELHGSPRVTAAVIGR
jgi:hypothetical protein